MPDQWPPPAPNLNKAFKKAHNATNDNMAPAVPPPIVTKRQIEELEQQRKKPAPALNLNPPGMKQNTSAQQAHEKRIARMNEQLQAKKGKAKDDFQRSV